MLLLPFTVLLTLALCAPLFSSLCTLVLVWWTIALFNTPVLLPYASPCKWADNNSLVQLPVLLFSDLIVKY